LETRGKDARGGESKSHDRPFYWNKLSQLHPTDVCNRTEAIYHPAREGFLLPVYNLRYLVLPKEKEILRMDGMINLFKKHFTLIST